MNFKEYRTHTPRTLPDMGSLILNSVHMVLGMTSELVELFEAIEKEDKVNVGEELTDIVWYVSNYCNLRNISSNTLTGERLGIYTIPLSDSIRSKDYIDNKVELRIKMLTSNISQLVDYDKKEFCYKRPETEEIRLDRIKRIEWIIFNLNKLYNLFNLDAELCMQNNIDKLRARYPDKFDAEKANNRDLESERKQLEKE